MKRKKKMGRPPAVWMKKLVESSLQDNVYLNASELGSALGTDRKNIIAFLQRVKAPRKYEIIDGNSLALFRVKDVRDVVKKHLEAWQ